MGEAEFPTCWLFSLRWPSTGAYRAFGGANGGLWEGSHRGVLPQTSAASVLVPTMSDCCPPPLQDTLQHKQVGLVQSPLGSLLLPPWSDVHTALSVPSKSDVSVSPRPVQVLQPYPSSLLIILEFLLTLPDPQVGKPDVGLRTCTPVGGLLWYNCSPVCESPTQQLWDFILLWLCPSYHLFAASPLSLVVGYLFWWVPLSSCRWLFSCYLWFWCSCKREWAHILLLHRLEPICPSPCLQSCSSHPELLTVPWKAPGIILYPCPVHLEKPPSAFTCLAVPSVLLQPHFLQRAIFVASPCGLGICS